VSSIACATCSASTASSRTAAPREPPETRAERIARSITFGNDFWRDAALTQVAIAVAAADPGRAERITQSIALSGGSRRRGEALAAVATALAVTDPDRAERLAYAVTDKVGLPQALAGIAAALATARPGT
jgi:hypothetical protein